MSFDEILAQVLALLQREGRVSYRALKRRFALDDEYLEDLKVEIIQAKKLAIDEDGTVLVWTGGTAQSSSPLPPDTVVSSQFIERGTLAGERRQLTVMFCDLVGSTTLSEQLDPEELREVLHEYHAVCATVISRFEGHVAQYLGDGLLVYFGYPSAHEDDARRAVRVGLEIVEEVKRLNARLQQTVWATRALSLQVRVGIHTGLVVVAETGAGDRPETLALGDTPNIAARLQGLAGPDTVVLSSATHRLIEGFFAYQALGVRSLRGLSQSLEVYRVLSESGVQSRFDVAVSAGLTPLVGREQEVGFLLERWQCVKEGTGQVVLLSGEAGIGKSRLVRVLKERIVQEVHAWIECRCSPYHQHSALYPIIDHLRRLLQLGGEDSPQEKLRKLEATLEEYRFISPEVAPLFAVLLSLPVPDHYPHLSLTPQRQKQKTLEALLAWLLKEAEKQPLWFVVEDLHWVDPSTLELLDLLISQVPTARILVLLTSRPDFRPPWTNRSHLMHLTLSRLANKQVEALAEGVTGGKNLPAEVLQQVVSKTDGIPLFVEELTKMVVESGLLREVDGHYELAGPLPPLAIPATLQDSLMARLDRLAAIKEVAQLAATLGREFSYAVLRAVSPIEETELRKSLAALVQAELLYRRGLPRQVRYVFKHVLIQEAAYQSLLKSKRQHYHQRIAHVLEEQFPETAETQPEFLAHHYTEAGLKEQAIAYWQRAGERAIKHSDNEEAIAHLTKGLELLNTLPSTPERVQQELMLQTTLGTPLMITKGYAAPEVGKVYARARELCQQMEETPQLFPVLVGLWVFYNVRGELQTARELGEQCLTLAKREQDPAFSLWAYWALGSTLFLLGELVPARKYLEQGIASYNPQKRRARTFRAAQDPGVVCLCYTALALWLLGYPDQALQRINEALTLAQELPHAHSVAFALNFSAWLHQYRREERITQARAEAVIALSAEQGFPFWLAGGTMLRGWALVEQACLSDSQEQKEEGIAQIHQGLTAWQATGAGLWRPYFSALLAEACWKVGWTQEGFTMLTEAVAVVDENGERVYEAELYRLKGELTLQQSQVSSSQFQVTGPHPLIPNPQAEAEKCFLKAIETARRQSAKSLELRAVISLARVWRQQGKREEARQMLVDIYEWFTEGFDTGDLREAKALLAELSSSSS